MAMNALRRFAADGTIPVFAAVGRNASARVDDLSLGSGIEFVASPRHASVLLVAGKIRRADREALHRIHDQLPHPRATLCWGAEAAEGIASAATVADSDDPQPMLRILYKQLLCGDRASEAHLLPDAPPVPWRGLGENGQGGNGMMGGTPYGRPMAMTADDLRDGLALDEYTVRVGPFLPTFPAGLVLELTLQGDVIQHAKVVRPPLPDAEIAGITLRQSMRASLPDGDIERKRAAHCLRCVARVLVILQLMPQAQRCRRMAHRMASGDAVDVASLRTTLQRAGVFKAIPEGLGRIHKADGRDVRARIHRWLDEAEHAAVIGAPPSQENVRFADLLPGLEWGEAMLVIASFDAEALCRISPAPDQAISRHSAEGQGGHAEHAGRKEKERHEGHEGHQGHAP